MSDASSTARESRERCGQESRSEALTSTASVMLDRNSCGLERPHELDMCADRSSKTQNRLDGA
jgi:hypothetical protein